jgi:DNA invertase Pin-like site-specific DNA recombinase
MRKAALYLRVSTDGQTVDDQRLELVAAATRHGWRIVAEYVDLGISSAKDRHGRPGLSGLLKGVASSIQLRPGQSTISAAPFRIS